MQRLDSICRICLFIFGLWAFASGVLWFVGVDVAPPTTGLLWFVVAAFFLDSAFDGG